MPLIASDGLEYEDIAARLHGKPTENARNRAIRLYRSFGYCEAGIGAWWETFDICKSAGFGHAACVGHALDAAHQINGFGSAHRKP